MINQESTLLLDDIKTKIYNIIFQTPGIRYRQLLRLTGLANGVLTYHLTRLEKSKYIKADRFSYRTTRYYTIIIPEDETKIINHLQNNIARQITNIFLRMICDLCGFSDIVDYIKRPPSTISYHIKRLRDAEIINSIRGRNQELVKKIQSGTQSQNINRASCFL